MTPSLKELALAIQAYDSSGKITIAATPERILQYRDEVLEEAARCAEMTPIAGMKSKTGVPDKIAAAIRSIKSKEPSP